MPLSTFHFHLGIVGYPLTHSLSPQLHTAALDACGLQGDYSLFPVPPDVKQELRNILSRVRVGELHGLNVTIPHKQNVIEFLDELTPTAKAIGAVNTIYLRGGKLIGDNTDAPGFLSDLNRFLFETQSHIGNRISAIANRKSAIVLGAGGSARAVVHALLTDGWNVTLSARRLEQAEQLSRSFPNYAIHTTQYLDFRLSTFDLLVNATPLGMYPDTDQSPLPENVMLPPNVIVYDLIYNPRETKLVRDARSQGLHAATGLGMLIEQAALSFEIWTEQDPPREILFQSIET